MTDTIIDPGTNIDPGTITETPAPPTSVGEAIQPHFRNSSSPHGVVLVVRTGVPWASASVTTLPRFSEKLGNTKKSA